MAKLRVPALVVLGAVLACLLAAWLLGPGLIERGLARAVADHASGRFSAERVRFNPLTLTAVLDDVNVAGPAGEQSISVPRVEARLHPSSFTRRRWVWGDVVAREPALSFGIEAGGAAALPAAAAKRIAALAGFTDRAGLEVGRLVIVDGRLQFGWRDGEKNSPGRIAVTELELVLGEPAVDAARPFQVGATVEQSAELRAEGCVRASPLTLDADLALTSGDIAWFTRHLGTPLSQRLRSGPFAGKAELEHRADRLRVSADWELAHLAIDAAEEEIRIREIGGSLRHSGREAESKLDARGVLGSGELALTASWPGGGRTLEELGLRLENVELSALSPYPARILGVDEVSGRLSLDAVGRPKGAVLGVDNRVRIEELSFATAASGDDDLRLAVALTEDADGRIDVRLPLPPLSLDREIPLAAILADAVGERVAALTSSPFSALGRLEGAPGEDLGRLEFEAGSADLLPAAVDKLAVLGDVLQRRPKLGLRVFPAYAPGADRRALASGAVRLHVALATSAGPPGASRPALDVDDPKVRDVLDEFAGSRLSAERRAALAERFPDDESARYAAVFDALVDNEAVADTALVRLARYRSRSILDRLAAVEIPRERLASAGPAETSAVDGDRVSVELGVWAAGDPTSEAKRED